MIAQMMSKGLSVVSERVQNALGIDRVKLPPPQMRFCGQRYRDDQYFLSSANQDIDRFVKWCNLKRSSRVVDLGCGPGRLAIGILNRLGGSRTYLGCDVHRPSIDWCQQHIATREPAFRFTHIDVHSERYNPGGKPLDARFRLPCDDRSVDVLIACSLFSHLLEHELPIYFREISRVLARDGKAFLTGFLEDDVPHVSVNPTDYRHKQWDGPAHCVRYNKMFFESRLRDFGMTIERFDYEEYFDGESAIYVGKR